MGSPGRRQGRRTRSDREPGNDWSALLPQAPHPPRGPRWWRRIVDWLYRPVEGQEPPGPDALVELTRTPSRFDAEAIVRELQLHDVRATVFGGDADGTAPHYGALQGHRVMIRAADIERATTALSRR